MTEDPVFIFSQLVIGWGDGRLVKMVAISYTALALRGGKM